MDMRIVLLLLKNSRSARSIEANMNGFHISDAIATRIMENPDVYEEKANQKFREWSRGHAPGHVNNPDLQ